MNIIIPVKQVPNTANISIDPVNNTLIRKSTESIINPFDLHAIEAGVAIKEKTGAKVTALSMGPPHAKNALIESIARGADNAVLLSDKKFSGSDTLATSYTIFKMIRERMPFDLIICGRQAIDGDTAQVGPELSEFLDIPLMTNVTKIIEADRNFITVEMLLDSGFAVIKTALPALITVTKNVNVPRIINLKKLYTALNSPIAVYDSMELNIDFNLTGLKGSPTKVKKIKQIEIKKDPIFLNGNPDIIAGELLNIIKHNINKKNRNESDVTLLNEKDTDQKQNIVLIGEDNDYIISRSSYELSYIAKKLSLKNKAKISMIFATDDPDRIISGNIMPDTHKIIFIKNANFNKICIEIIAASVVCILKNINPQIMLGTSGLFGRSLLPRIAVKLNTGLTADCTGLDIDETTGLLQQTRPAYGGNLTALIETSYKRPQMATVRSNVFPFIINKSSNPEIKISEYNGILKIGKEILSINKFPEKETNLEDAKIIISGGRGINGKSGFDLLNQAASALNAGVGSSRSAVDAGWISYIHQIGQTGKTVSPEIYIACGISGAVQHLAGMQSSGIIISINKDKNAPIFGFSDYAVVSDYKLILTELINMQKGKNEKQ